MTIKTANSSGFPLRSIAILLGVFLMGSVFGAGVVMFSVKRKVQKMAQLESPGPRVKKNFERLNKYLGKTLELTPEETAVVEAELNTTLKRMVRIRVAAFMGVRREAVDSVDRIATQLPEAKGEKLRAMAKKRLGPWGMAFPERGD